jgi:hypothetical protein
MRRFAVLFAAFAVVLLPAFALAQDVNTDSDPKAPFATFKTYAWVKGEAAANPLNETRIHEGVVASLAKAGLKEAAENPDIVVATHAMAKEQKELYATGMGGSYRWGGGMGTISAQTYVVGTLVVDIWDAKTKQLIWRGTAQDTMSDKPEKNAQKISKAIEKMFKNYPPKAK